MGERRSIWATARFRSFFSFPSKPTHREVNLGGRFHLGLFIPAVVPGGRDGRGVAHEVLHGRQINTGIQHFPGQGRREKREKKLFGQICSKAPPKTLLNARSLFLPSNKSDPIFSQQGRKRERENRYIAVRDFLSQIGALIQIP